MDDQPVMNESRQSIVCPNCGHEQEVTGTTGARCEQCGEVLHTLARGPQLQATSGRFPDQADPTEVAAPQASGGIGRTTDGTQAPHTIPTAEPGKPMPPTTDEAV